MPADGSLVRVKVVFGTVEVEDKILLEFRLIDLVLVREWLPDEESESEGLEVEKFDVRKLELKVGFNVAVDLKLVR